MTLDNEGSHRAFPSAITAIGPQRKLEPESDGVQSVWGRKVRGGSQAGCWWTGWDRR
jgi:hypothetical protein